MVNKNGSIGYINLVKNRSGKWGGKAIIAAKNKELKTKSKQLLEAQREIESLKAKLASVM